MSVLPGEGTHIILYGSTAIPARTQTHQGYLARPDLAGRYPTVIVVPDAASVTSGVKALCRALARHGVVALAVDPYRGMGPGRRATPEEVEQAFAALPPRRMLADLGDVVRYLRSPATEWSAGERLGIIGLGAGGNLVLRFAVDEPSVVAVALAYAVLAADDGPPAARELLATGNMALLGLYGTEDDRISPETVRGYHAAAGRGEWVLYDGAGAGFLDDSGDGNDEATFTDAVGRLVAFFGRTLAATSAVAEA